MKIKHMIHTAGLTGIVLLLFTIKVTAQTSYIQDDIIKKAGITTDPQINALSATDKQTTRVYYDGQNRPMQAIAVKASPKQKDIVQQMVYNSLGQQVKTLLPYTDGTYNGAYQPDAIADQLDFYSDGTASKVAQDGSPFSQQVFENSPLQRLLKSGMVGDGFQPVGGTGTQHYKTVGYRANSAANDGNITMYGPDATKLGNYDDYKLSVTVAIDEDGAKAETFTDLRGLMVLKRTLSGSTNYSTYYIYNNAGMISYVIPPVAADKMAAAGYDPEDVTVKDLVYKYIYDARGRVVQKKVPTAGIIYIVYDPLNRPVLVQDGRLRGTNQWNYIKYDVKDHAISQGVYTDATHTTLSSMQTYVSGLDYSTTWYESRTTATSNGFYTNAVFPTSNISALAFSYYDNYDIDNDGSNEYNYVVQSLTNESLPTSAPLKGVPTMTQTRTIGSGLSDILLLKAVFYDKNGHVIQTQSNNHLNYTARVVTDYATSAVNFSGIPTQTKVSKTIGTGTANTTTVLTSLSYDHMYRPTVITQKYNSGATKTVAAYSYNEIGQLVTKNLDKLVSGTVPDDVVLNTTYSGTNTVVASNSITLSNATPGFTAPSGSIFHAYISNQYLSSTDQLYNIRGQLLSINDSKLAEASDVFGMQMLYDKVDGDLDNTPYFNGKPSAVKWMSRDATGAKSYERAYRYNYDAQNRYTGETYAERTAASTAAFTVTHGWDESNIAYDKNGNIQSLDRYDSSPGAGTSVHIDHLGYTYDANNDNQLVNVTDGTTTQYTGAGFRNLTGSTANYTYDSNGNLTADPYKGITSISYNLINRANRLSLPASQYVDYTYDASGTLIRKQAKNGSTTQTTDYIDGFVYLNSTLSYFPMPEGRVRNDGGTLKQEFVMADQQGNARISFEDDGSGNPVVRQENSYYGFGLVLPGSPVSPTPANPNKQLYNGGSEWQNDYADNLPDYYNTFYRNFDAALGRFIAVDPDAESSESLSVYNYSGNNPIVYNDPLGNLKGSIFTYDTNFTKAGGGGDDSDGMDMDGLDDIGGDDSGVSSDGLGLLTNLGTLLNSPYGGTTNASGTYLFTNSTSAYYAGVAYLNQTNSWGRYGAAANYGDAQFAYNTSVPASQRHVNMYHTENWVTTMTWYDEPTADGISGEGSAYLLTPNPANQGGYWSNLDWKGIGDATIGMLGGAGEIATASATEVGSEGLSTAVSVPLAIDGWGRVGTNFNRLAAYFGGNKALGDALPSNIGGYVGKTVDIFSGVDLYSTGNGQAILGGTNDLLLMISPWGNAGAWKSVLETPNLWNTVGLGVSYYGGIIGFKNDVQSLPKR